jgi:GT2 family glycosyltransferase
VKEETDLFRCLDRLGIEKPWFFENNREGLSTCYNRVLDESAGRNAIALFVHDDVLIEDLFLHEKLDAGAGTFAIQGLAGASSFDLQPGFQQTVWTRAPREHLSGAVCHTVGPQIRMWAAYGPVPQSCVVLDGLFLAVDLTKIGNVRFDERLLFNFYDLDFCLSAYEASLSIGTVNVHAHHRSIGDFGSPAFFEAQEIFRNKWVSLKRQ